MTLTTLKWLKRWTDRSQSRFSEIYNTSYGALLKGFSCYVFLKCSMTWPWRDVFSFVKSSSSRCPINNPTKINSTPHTSFFDLHSPQLHHHVKQHSLTLTPTTTERETQEKLLLFLVADFSSFLIRKKKIQEQVSELHVFPPSSTFCRPCTRHTRRISSAPLIIGTNSSENDVSWHESFQRRGFGRSNFA